MLVKYFGDLWWDKPILHSKPSHVFIIHIYKHTCWKESSNRFSLVTCIFTCPGNELDWNRTCNLLETELLISTNIRFNNWLGKSVIKIISTCNLYSHDRNNNHNNRRSSLKNFRFYKQPETFQIWKSQCKKPTARTTQKYIYTITAYNLHIRLFWFQTRLLGRPQPQMYPPVALNQHTLVNRTHKHYIYICFKAPQTS